MRYIKCPNCQKFNLNKDRCTYCNTSLMVAENRRQQQLKEREIASEKNKNAPKKGVDLFYDKMKNHRWMPFRWLAVGMKSMWLIFIGITTLIALALSVFAG